MALALVVLVELVAIAYVSSTRSAVRRSLARCNRFRPESRVAIQKNSVGCCTPTI